MSTVLGRLPVNETHRTLDFGEFRLDLKRRRLIRGTESTPLPERLFGVLSLLVGADGALVEKQTFATTVWSDVVMTDSNLAQHIYQLRQLLGEKANCRSYISSASGRGYRFTAPVYPERYATDSLFATPELDAKVPIDFEPFLYVGQANYLLENRGRPAVERAIQLFGAALAIDAEYIPALLGIARAHAFLAERCLMPRSTALQRAKAAIARVLEIDPNSAAGHAIRCTLLLVDDWDWIGARREIDVALCLAPRNPLVLQSLAWLNVCNGSYDSAMAAARSSALKTPASATALLLVAEVLVHSRRHHDAIALLSNVLEHDPTFHAARLCRARAYLLDERPREAAIDLNLLTTDRHEDLSVRLPLLARAYADSGDQARAATTYAELLEATESGCGSHVGLATVATGLSELAAAIGHLEQALREREPTLLLLKSLPLLKPIAQFERFKAIARAVAPPGLGAQCNAIPTGKSSPVAEPSIAREGATSPFANSG